MLFPDTDIADRLPRSSQQVRLTATPQGNKYSVHTPDLEDASVVLTLPPHTGFSAEEEAFQEVLEQYSGIQRSVSTSEKDDRGRVELVDEHGNLLGTLDRSIQPSSSSSSDLKGGDATIVTIDDDASDASSFVSADDFAAGEKPAAQTSSAAAPALPKAPAGESDWLINGAQYVSRGIITVGGWVGGTVEKAANKYTSKGSADTAYSAPEKLPTSNQTGTGLDANALGSDAIGTRSGAASGATTPSGSGTKTPSRNVNVHPSISKGLQALSDGSGHVVRLSGSARKALLDASEGAGRRMGGARKNKDGTAREPGTIRKQIQRGAQAANVVLDGFDTALGGILESVTNSSGQVVEAKFGPSAAQASGQIGKVGKNCFLVYKDVSGVRRKCLLKLAGGTLKGRTVDGQEITIAAQPTGDAVQQTATTSVPARGGAGKEKSQ